MVHDAPVEFQLQLAVLSLCHAAETNYLGREPSNPADISTNKSGQAALCSTSYAPPLGCKKRGGHLFHGSLSPWLQLLSPLLLGFFSDAVMVGDEPTYFD
jgi:hypothetical protein